MTTSAKQFVLMVLMLIGMSTSAVAQMVTPPSFGAPVPTGSFTSWVRVGDGTSALPALAFLNEPALGLWRVSTSVIGIGNPNVTGANPVSFTTTGIALGSGMGLNWSSATGASAGSADLSVFREAADHWFQRRTTTAQRVSWANTYTSSTNYTAFSIDWQTTADTAIVGTRTAATGTGRLLQIAAQSSTATDAYLGWRLSPVSLGAFPYAKLGYFNSVGSQLTNSNDNAGNWFVLGDILSSAIQNARAIVAITPAYNQASGTASNTDLLIDRTETAVGSGIQRLIDGRVGGSSRFAVSTLGAISIGGANGQVFGDVQSLTELTTIAAAATTDTTIQMPANSVVLGVSVRVTVVIPTAATFTVGDSGSAARFSTAAVTVAANSTDPGTKAGAYYNASALSIRITPNLTPANNTGRVRVTIYYYTVTPPTS